MSFWNLWYLLKGFGTISNSITSFPEILWYSCVKFTFSLLSSFGCVKFHWFTHNLMYDRFLYLIIQSKKRFLYRNLVCCYNHVHIMCTVPTKSKRLEVLPGIYPDKLSRFHKRGMVSDDSLIIILSSKGTFYVR